MRINEDDNVKTPLAILSNELNKINDKGERENENEDEGKSFVHSQLFQERSISGSTYSLHSSSHNSNIDDEKDGSISFHSFVQHKDGYLKQGKLLFISLLENYCSLFEDKERNMNFASNISDDHPNLNLSLLFGVLCAQLVKMGILQEEDLSIASVPVRNTYRLAFEKLVTEAFQQLKSSGIPGLPLCNSKDPIAINDPSSRYLIQPEMNNFDQLNENPVSRFHEDFVLLQLLGRGAFGSVYCVRNKLDDLEYAIKFVLFNSVHHYQFNQYKRVLREVYSLARLDHPNIVRYNSAWIEPHPLPNVGISSCERQNINVDRSISEDIEEESTVIDRINESQYDKEMEKTNLDFLNKRKKMTLCIQMQLCKFTLKDWISWRNEIIFSESIRSPFFYHVASSISTTCGFSKCFKSFNSDTVDLQEILKIFRQIVTGLHYIHSHGFIHRDLKPQNIFFYFDSNEFIVKIGDFSLVTSPSPLITNYIESCSELPTITTAVVDDCTTVTPFKNPHYVVTSNKNDDLHTSGIGTYIYASPEQLSYISSVKSHESSLADSNMLSSHYNQKSDIYSLGIIFFELIVPFYCDSERIHVLEHLKKENILPSEFVTHYPKEAAFILWCTASDPEKRPSAEEILAHLDMLDTPKCISIKNDKYFSPSSLYFLKDSLTAGNDEKSQHTLLKSLQTKISQLENAIQMQKQQIDLLISRLSTTTNSQDAIAY